MYTHDRIYGHFSHRLVAAHPPPPIIHTQHIYTPAVFSIGNICFSSKTILE